MRQFLMNFCKKETETQCKYEIAHSHMAQRTDRPVEKKICSCCLWGMGLGEEKLPILYSCIV